MDSRERVFLALNREEPDRVPVDFWVSPWARNIIATSIGMTAKEFLNSNDVDLRYIDGPVYNGDPLKPEHDIWGIRRSDASDLNRKS